MKVRIDNEDFTDFIETGYPLSGGKLTYRGKAVENEGLRAESLLEQLPEHKPIRVEDSERRLHGRTTGIYEIENKNGIWDCSHTLFSFKIELKKV